MTPAVPFVGSPSAFYALGPDFAKATNDLTLFDTDRVPVRGRNTVGAVSTPLGVDIELVGEPVYVDLPEDVGAWKIRVLG